MPDQGDKTEKAATATSCEKKPVQKTLKKKDPVSRSGRRRQFPVDAAAAINLEDGAEGIQRQLPPVDAAAEATSKKEDPGSLSKVDPDDLTAGVDDDLTDVSEVQELSAEEELLRAVGLDVLE